MADPGKVVVDQLICGPAARVAELTVVQFVHTHLDQWEACVRLGGVVVSPRCNLGALRIVEGQSRLESVEVVGSWAEGGHVRMYTVW